MGILCTGDKGISLREILKNKYNDRDFETIMCRCLWELDDEERDDLIGYCSYIDGELIPLDGDSYSLEDLYIKDEYDEEDNMLIIWENGYCLMK